MRRLKATKHFVQRSQSCHEVTTRCPQHTVFWGLLILQRSDGVYCAEHIWLANSSLGKEETKLLQSQAELDRTQHSQQAVNAECDAL